MAAKAAATEAGLGPVCRNPYRSIVVRAVETLYAIESDVPARLPFDARRVMRTR